MKKIISLMMAITILCNMILSSNAKELTDIETSWAKESINRLVDLGITTGYTDGTFKPNAKISILEYTAFVERALEEAPEKWGQPYIDKAIQLGLFKKDQYKDYNRPITREEMAAIIINALEYKLETSIETEKDLNNKIQDFNQITSMYVDGVLKAYSSGIITGFTDGNFKPGKNATRAEATVVIIRLLDYVATQTDEQDQEEVKKPVKEITLDQEFIDKYVKADELKDTLTFNKQGDLLVEGHKPTNDYVPNTDRLISAFVKNTVGTERYTGIEFYDDQDASIYMAYAYNDMFYFNKNYYFSVMINENYLLDGAKTSNNSKLSSSIGLSISVRRLNEVDGSSSEFIDERIWQVLKSTVLDMFPTEGEEISKYIRDMYLKSIEYDKKHKGDYIHDKKIFGDLEIDFINPDKDLFLITLR